MSMLTSLATLAALAAPAATAAPAIMSPTMDTTQIVEIESTHAATWDLWVDREYSVQRGYNYSPVYDFGGRPAHVDAVKAELFVPRGQICNAAIYSIDLVTRPGQRVFDRYYPNREGEVELPDTDVYQAIVILQQSAARLSRCVLQLSGLAAGGTDPEPDPSDFELAGAMHYEGGFRNRLEMDVSPDKKITEFWVRVPSFCENVDILEAGTVSEGFFDPASLIDAEKHVFAVNGGAGARATSIGVALNGPAGNACDIPIYAKYAD